MLVPCQQNPVDIPTQWLGSRLTKYKSHALFTKPRIYTALVWLLHELMGHTVKPRQCPITPKSTLCTCCSQMMVADQHAFSVAASRPMLAATVLGSFSAQHCRGRGRQGPEGAPRTFIRGKPVLMIWCS